MAVLIVSNLDFKLEQSLISLSSQTKPTKTRTLCFKPCSKHSFPKCLRTKTKIMPIICKYGDFRSPITHDEKRSKRTETSATPVLEPESHPRKIWWSEVKVKRPKNLFLGRKWTSKDIQIFSAHVVVHGLALFGPFTFNWGAFWMAVGLYIMTGMLGICLSYHRHLSHKSFKIPKWLEYFFAYCGVLAFQNDPIYWVRTHRHHHQFVDSEQDIHSPINGFWFSHVNWMFDSTLINEKCSNLDLVKDLVKQPFYRFISKTYYLHPLLLAVLLYVWGGFPYLVWGIGVRTVLLYHTTFAVNSIGHIWGKQAWNTGGLSKNNWVLALMLFGEGWHNNHHAFEYSARHGLEWWQIDMTWYFIKLLETVGLATDVKLPTEAHKRRVSIGSD